MAASGRQQIFVLNTALRKQAGRFKHNDPSPYLAAAASLANDGVCARCLLRLGGHANLDDYALPSPSRAEILALLGRAAAASDPKSGTTSPASSPPQQPTPSSPPDAVAAATGAPDPPCPACFGLLQTLLDEKARVRQAVDVACASPPNQPQPQPERRPAAAAPGVGAEAGAGPDGGSVDLAWLKIQQKALAGATGCRTGPTAGHECLPGFVSAADLAEAVRRQADNCTPGSSTLAAAAAAPVAPPAAPAGSQGDCSADVVMAEAAAAPAVEEGSADAAAAAAATSATAAADGSEASPPKPAAASDDVPPLLGGGLGPEDIGQPLPLRSFSLEVTALPAAWALRDAAIFAWASSYYDSKKVPYTGWRASDIIPLPTVLRRALPLVLSRTLGVPSAAPQAADVAVTVAVLDGEDGLADLQVLAEDLAARQPRRQQHQPYYQRFNKRQRGGRGGAGGEQADGAGAEKGLEERARHLGWEQAIAATVNMPRHVVERLLPWPPRQLPQPQPQQQPPPQQPQQQQQRARENEGEKLQQPQPSATEGAGNAPTTGPGAEGSVAPAAEAAAEAAAAAVAEDPVAEAAAEATVAAAAEAPAPASGANAASTAGSAQPAGTQAAVSVSPCGVYVRTTHAPLLLAGRYCKLRRHMPQCPWFVLSTGARIGGVSVQECIERFVLPLYGTTTAKMITGGREDADVRMLGSGRPFVLEIQEPLRGHPTAEGLRRAEQRMRDSKCGVTVQSLKPCNPGALEAIKAAEESKEKTYRALCWAAEAPTPSELAALVALGKVDAHQDTPVRVLHRRAAKIRPKWIKIESATAVTGKPHYFVLQLRTQAGTYVKEFCHGDFGRCQPSVGELLGRIRAKATAPAATGNAAATSTKAAASSANGATTQAKPAGAAANGATTQAKPAGAAANGATTQAKSAGAAANGATTQAKPAGAAANGATTQAKPAAAAANGATTQAKPAGAAANGSTTQAKPAGAAANGATTQAKPAAAAANGATTQAKPAAAAAGVKGGAVPATANGHAAKGAGAGVRPGAGVKGGGNAGNSGSSTYVHVEIVQLDVLDVHLEDWP